MWLRLEMDLLCSEQGNVTNVYIYKREDNNDDNFSIRGSGIHRLPYSI